MDSHVSFSQVQDVSNFIPGSQEDPRSCGYHYLTLWTGEMQLCFQNAAGEGCDFCNSLRHLSSMSLLTSECVVHLVLAQVCIRYCCHCKDWATVQKGIRRFAGL